MLTHELCTTTLDPAPAVVHCRDPKNPGAEATEEGPEPVPATPVVSVTISLPRLEFHA